MVGRSAVRSAVCWAALMGVMLADQMDALMAEYSAARSAARWVVLTEAHSAARSAVYLVALTETMWVGLKEASMAEYLAVRSAVCSVDLMDSKWVGCWVSLMAWHSAFCSAVWWAASKAAM